MSTTTKRDLIEKVVTKTTLSSLTARSVIQEFLDEIVSELRKGNRIELRDFGVFEVRERPARTAQNPRTLEPVQVPAKRSVRFKPGRLMRETLTTKSTKVKPAKSAAPESIAEVKPLSPATAPRKKSKATRTSEA